MSSKHKSYHTAVLVLLVCLIAFCEDGANNKSLAQSSQGSATPESFQVTLYEFSLCKTSSCLSKLVLVNSAQEFDIATVSSGQSAGTFGGGNVTIEAGTYQYAYLVWGRYLGLRGRVPFSLSGYDRDCISVAGASMSDYGGSVGSILTQNSGTPGSATQYITAGDDQSGSSNITFMNNTQVSTLIALSNSVTLSTSDTTNLPAMTVSFNVTDTLRVFINENGSGNPDDWGCEIGLEPPVITFQIGSQSTTINLNTGS